MSTVVILGAGVDASLGIPTSRDFIPKIVAYLQTDEGKAIDDSLRKIIKNVRFHFDTFIDNAIDNMAKGLEREMGEICTNINEELHANQALTEKDKQMGQLISKLFGKIIDVKNGAAIDEETERLIHVVLGTQVNDDAIIDFSKINFTDTFKSVVVQILKQSINDSQHPILRHVYKNILDIEKLLAKYFYGFYTGQSYNIRIYMYIAWVMWAYLVHEEKRVTADYLRNDNYINLPVYGKLKDDWEVISFNYTSFAKQFHENTYYFHGQIANYVDIKNGNDLDVGNIVDVDFSDFFDDVLAHQISFDPDFLQYAIPTFLPPLELKPVISRQYITVWYKSWEVIKNADKIIILGYSCNQHDDHFNSILKDNKTAEIVIVDKDLETVADNICTILSLDKNHYTPNRIQEKDARKYANRITIIEAELHEVNIETL